MNPLRARVYTYLLIANVIWGIGAVVIKYTLIAFDPSIFLLYRFAISSLIVLLMYPFVKLTFPSNPRVLIVLLVHATLTSTIGLGLLFLGMDKTTAIDATLISATAPLFIAVAGVRLFHEHLTKKELLGISIAFIGTAITVIEPLLRNHDRIVGLTGNILVFASVLAGVMTAVTTKMLMKEDIKPENVVNTSFLVGFITMIPIALINHSPSEIIKIITVTPVEFHLGVWFMAILSGTLAYILWSKAEKSIEIGEVGVFAYLPPIFTTPLAVLFLAEKLTFPFIIGAVVITIGVLIAEIKKKNP